MICTFKVVVVCIKRYKLPKMLFKFQVEKQQNRQYAKEKWILLQGTVLHKHKHQIIVVQVKITENMWNSKPRIELYNWDTNYTIYLKLFFLIYLYIYIKFFTHMLLLLMMRAWKWLVVFLLVTFTWKDLFILFITVYIITTYCTIWTFQLVNSPQIVHSAHLSLIGAPVGYR